MTVLILNTMPEEVRNRYRGLLQAAFPDIHIDLVDHYSKVDPFVAEARVLITFAPMLRDEVLAKATRLEWVQALGTGVDNLIDQPSLRPGVLVTNIHGIHEPPVAEAAIAAMLALARDLPRALRSQDARRWDRWPGTLLHGKVLGIFGVGAIAAELAPRCQALGMRVIGISSAPDRQVAGFDAMRPSQNLPAAVADLDFLVLLTPLTAATRHAVGAEALAAMKPTSRLVNLARGGVLREDDLLAALAAGRIAGAALDVFEEEPLSPEHPLWSAPNIILTAHLGGFFDAYVDRAMPTIVHNMRSFLAGRRDAMVNVVRR